jgi:Dolichyl-phosphate-mannose-protein mannosyltransferase
MSVGGEPTSSGRALDEVAFPDAARLTVYSLVAAALSLRLAYYLINPTFSTDEAQLALNVLHRSYAGLFHQLDFNQAAPVGFLFVEKLAIGGLGSSEYAFRLFPLVSAIVAALLFYPVASKFIGRQAALLALILFTVSGVLLFYGATSKPYSTDVAVALALYAAIFLVGDNAGRRWWIVLALAGGIAVWLSYPAIFVLAGVGSVLILDSLLGYRWGRVTLLLLVCAVWLSNFAASYMVTHSSIAHIQRSFAGDSAARIAVGGNSASAFKSYGGAVQLLLGIPHFGVAARYSLVFIGILLCVVGLGSLSARRWTHALLLVAPALFALLASAIGKYPLYARTLLFLVPALLILIARGIWFLAGRARPRPLAAGAGAAFAALFIASVVVPTNHLFVVQDGGELKQAMRYLAHNQQPADSLYVYSRAQYDLRYYLECGCFADRSTVRRAHSLWPLRPTRGSPAEWAPAMRSVLPRLVVGNSASTVGLDYEPDVARLRGRSRVWILIAGAAPESSRALISFLDKHSTREKTFRTRNDVAAVNLYSFGR